jgi:hypothetical protein
VIAIHFRFKTPFSDGQNGHRTWWDIFERVINFDQTRTKQQSGDQPPAQRGKSE